ncbi:hypothetical protein [Clostridium botulinum]|uniref:Uncharacterized protein n=1 Tax=Clostridium botulinum TaxID=1491 RepID=A0A9Q1UZN7_CLOBO|nr:hypothetical protein [Clostridium botulinum]AEB74860.1 conserved hypothetical protein [Clostridium botulinum BKT015925]KEI01811.1 hypothetical protein Z953_08545 [Clostridium botulinum D str. 16868]KEI03415.1 hypothetical protein Y848_05025 [Clostridium botulinum C/D str. Sp77]KLU76946.1 hypothetical protein CBC3_01030 [Clostridium botulinum V891]KOA77107.1 hypothetical protein ADU77_07975 [Clostridium botulinum]
MLKIILSHESYDKLKELLNNHNKDYNCVRLTHIKGCCKSSRVDIYLDILQDRKDYNIKYIKNIPFIYNKDFANNINSVEIIYKNSSFMMKVIPNKNCSSCEYGCHSNSTSRNNCNSCSH